MSKNLKIIDGNQAAAHIAHKTNEVCAIYPITPSSGMGEMADSWSANGQTNIWGTVPVVAELQSEGGASASVHGALQTGALTTTFTASQGLLLMIPNMYKIAGELTSTVFHVSARSLACHALSIFGDHSDVMATRSTGFGLLASSSIQEVMDMALISQAATLESRIPFVHFFEGFRSSHELNKIDMVEDDVIRAMIDDELVFAHRARAMNPEKPVLRGTSQNPDVYFQGRETVNPFYAATPGIVQKTMDRFAELTGRRYHLFDYHGAPDADKIAIVMGSGADTAVETVESMVAAGEKAGMIQVHLYRPFSVEHFIGALPGTVKSIAVLDRTKEPGSDGEPLYKDIVTAVNEAAVDGSLKTDGIPRILGGRYGLSSKEFTPAMVKGVFAELDGDKARNHFTVGINDDVSNSSIDYDKRAVEEADDVVRCMFYGLGSDGTVGANKNSIKIIGGETDNYAQGYFVYDSKKAGARTVSHLRFGPNPIRSRYLISSANFIACHQFVFLMQTDILRNAAEGAVFLLNSPYSQNDVWDKLPRKVQEQIIEKKLKFYAINAYDVAKETGMGARINTIMQTCFFAISGVLPKDEAIEKIKGAIKKTYGHKGDKVVEMNFKAVDQSLAKLHEIEVPDAATSKIEMPPVVPEEAPEFVQNVVAEIMAGRGDDLPVSAMPVDGTFPLSTTQWEKRNISLDVARWDEDLCIQCGNCAMVCPHAVIRVKNASDEQIKDAPEAMQRAKLRGKNAPEDMNYLLSVSVEDCTGCGLCVDSCLGKDKQNPGRKAINIEPKEPILADARASIKFFNSLPYNDRSELNMGNAKGLQYAQPLFEFSGACTGCGETAYVRILSQLFGDRALIANATGCSSIYGGNLPTTPWCQNADGHGPSWNNSLFEDCAEIGYGFRLTVDKHCEQARELLVKLRDKVGAELVDAMLAADQKDEAGVQAQRKRLAELRGKLADIDGSEARHLESIADNLVKRSVWMLGGDGWAYDIGYGGLDHVLASGRNVNALVLDTEVYSNTGGQASKSTPMGAVAKFAAGGSPTGKKDLGMISMCYGNIYVARVSMGANPRQVLKAFQEAEAYDGPSLIIAYAHCIAHGINMSEGLEHQKKAVDSGHWVLFRYNPMLAAEGKNPLTIDSKEPSIPLKDYAYSEVRYSQLVKSNPETAERLIELAQTDVENRWALYQKWAAE